MSSTENPRAGHGMVVLDIGGDIGALVVSAPAGMAGLEIEICPSGAPRDLPDEGAGWWQGEWRSHSHARPTTADAPEHTHRQAWPHVAIIGRPVAGGTEFSAVYPGLRQGRYELSVRRDEASVLSVTVHGGQVTTATWPASARGDSGRASAVRPAGRASGVRSVGPVGPVGPAGPAGRQ